MRRSSIPLPLIVLLAALLVLAGAMAIGDWMFRRETPGFADPNWDMTIDGGWAEMVRGGQLVFTAALLCVLALLHRHAAVLYAWAAALVVVAGDDMGGIHERLGAGLAAGLGLPAVAGLRPIDLGELAMYAVILALIAAAVVWTHRRSAPPARVASWRVGLIVAATGALVIVIDMGTIAVSDLVDPRIYYLLGMIELWTESAGASVLLVSVLLMVARGLPVPGDGLLGRIPESRVVLNRPEAPGETPDQRVPVSTA